MVATEAFWQASDLFERADVREAAWYACYTRVNQEKKVARLLTTKRVEHYLPLIDRARQWADRKKVIPWPLFPSYIFVRVPAERFDTVLTVSGVANIVRIDGKPSPISGDEIRNIAQFAERLSRLGLEPAAEPFEAGQRVRITSGPFDGLEGVVVERRGRKRVLVGLPSIRVGFEVDVGKSALRPIDI